MMSDHKSTLYKAALLHDIGKFWQRSETKSAILEELDETTLPNQQHWWLSFGFMRKFFGKDAERRKTEFIISTHHIDVLELAQRVWEKGLEEGVEGFTFKSKLNDIIGKIKDDKKHKLIEFIAEDFDRWLSEVGSVGALKKEFEEYFPLASLVCEADTLASKERDFQWVFNERPQESIFYRISLLRVKPPLPEYSQPIGRLMWNSYDIPKPIEEVQSFIKEQYKSQWAAFKTELPALSISNNETLLYLMKKYLWCVPSAYCGSIPDISLFEHSKLTAALALALHDYICQEEKSTLPQDWKFTDVKQFRTQKAFLLLCGDITGIQKYIYNIAHAGAMKALKGRSFWLQQVVDSIAFSILDACGLPHANLIFSTGGKFCLLLPNTSYVKTQVLAKVKPDLEKAIFDEFDGNLSLVFGEMEVSGDEMIKKKGEVTKVINESWANLFKETDNSKTRKQSFLLSQESTDFFEPESLYGELVTCQATKREICRVDETLILTGKQSIGYREYRYKNDKKEVKAYRHEDETGERFICEEQFLSQMIGWKIRRLNKAIVRHNEGTFKVPGLDKIDKKERIDFCKEDELSNISDPNRRVMIVNNDDILKLPTENTAVTGWKFYGGDWIPTKEVQDENSGTLKEREKNKIAD